MVGFVWFVVGLSLSFSPPSDCISLPSMMTWAPCPHGVRTRGKKFPASCLLCVGFYVLWLLQLGHGYCLEVWLLFFLLDEHSLFQSSSCKLWICSRRMSLNFWAQLLRTAHSCNNSAFPKIYESFEQEAFLKCTSLQEVCIPPSQQCGRLHGFSNNR